MTNEHWTFSSLGIWRKILLILLWLGTLMLTGGALVWLIVPEMMGEKLEYSVWVLVAIALAALAYSLWVHTSIVNRKTTHLIAIGITQIIPLANPVGALLIFLAYYTSKKELN